MITGLLVVGGIVILYLGRKKRGWLSCIAAGFCFIACILTYARAGTVALGAVLIWFVIWRFAVARRSEGSWLNRFLVILTCTCLLIPVTTNLSALLYRWRDMSDSSAGGSGRATFWKVSIDYYTTENEAAQIFGIGYNGMSEMLLQNYGDDIKHTHNDMFDMLLVDGFVGGVWLISLMCAFTRRACLPSIRSIEGASGIAIVIVYLCHSQLTGQIWGTDSMTYYTLSLTSLMAVAQSRHLSRVVLKPAFYPCEAIA
jgi:O-antigen ligase